MDMNVKELIEKRIEESGLTKKSFAERMGISPANLNSMIKSPSFPTLEKVAMALDMSLSQLFDEGETSEDTAHGSSLVCPHCGKPISVELGIVESKKEGD